MLNDTNTEDKIAYCEKGAEDEVKFVNVLVKKLNLPLIINPEKVKDKFALDLLDTRKSEPSDLKYQQTPFFKARSLYDLNPQYAVTINVKDIVRYLEQYGNPDIYFWLDWDKELEKEIGGKRYAVKSMAAIYVATTKQINKMNLPIHSYARRINDQNGNKKDSYIVDARRFECLFSCMPKRLLTWKT